MPDPDIIALEAALAEAETLAQRDPSPYADGPQWMVEKQEQDDARRLVWRLRHQLEAAREVGAKERQRIGIARRQLGIPDESHEARVYRITKGRTTTTADCTAAERRALLDEYRDLGFRVRPPTRAGRAPSPERLDHKAMLGKIQALLVDQRLPWSYAEAILRRQRGITDRGVSCPAALVTDEEARGLIAALANRQARQRRQQQQEQTT